MNPGRERLALLAAMATGIQVGAALVATRFIAQDIGPASLALLRYAIAVLCLLPFVVGVALRGQGVAILRRDVGIVMALGVVQFGLLIALLNVGLKYMPATRAGLLFTTFPLLTMLFAAALGREKLTAAKTAGVLLSIAGVAVTLGEGLLVETVETEWLGAACVLGAACCGAVCSVLYRPYLGRNPTLSVGTLAMFAAVLFLAILSLPEGLYAAPPALSPAGWAAVAFIGLSSGAGFLLWLWALKQTTPTRVTVFLALSPITAALLGVLLLGEALTPGTLVGLVAVIGGLWVATREKAHRICPPSP
ncbi:MAG: DMT family transporter [Rhodovibrionaceae bacterium]